MKETGVQKTLVVEAANVTKINNELEAAGQGPGFFSVPLCDKKKQNQDDVTHYGCSVVLTTAHEKTINAILLKYSTIVFSQDFNVVLTANDLRKPNKKVKEGFKHDPPPAKIPK